MSETPTAPPTPAGSATVDPFIMTDNAGDLARFLVDVFDATEVPDARTTDADGLVLHSELVIGNSTITIADRKPDWPYTPAFVRVYVEDPAATLERAAKHGARIVTEPTDFWGDVLSRFADPFGHLWWVYKHDPAASAWTEADPSATGEEHDGAGWEGTTSADATDDQSWESFTTPALAYIHTTLMDAMSSLKDPRSR
ncbi:VOC family protein [Ruania halotolerans]|uniref:VOC family protein n=1 Tax=Ruania halotolerans TaxID=2897773 RepID=UPI001E46E94B|nr:VOC family protein [Ruania halotolerans]UFU07249.1 VOC family protein [Ruania halotolerans]